MEGLLDSFALTIKIGIEKVKFAIVTDEGIDQMFQKLKKIHPQCESKKEETLSKLKHDLQSKLKTHNVKPNLVQTIEYYLNKNFKQQHSERLQLSREKHNSTTKGNSQLTTRNMSLKVSPATEKISEKQQNSTNNQPKQIPFNQVKQKVHPKVKSASVHQRPSYVQKQRSQPKKQHFNEDLVKAYQTIMQKSTQVDIKMMAKRCLEELGKLPQVERKVEPLLSHKYEVFPPEQKQLKSEHKQSKGIQKQDKSPIQIVDLPSEKRQSRSRLSYEPSGDMTKLSDRSPYPKLFAPSKYNYMVNHNAALNDTKYSPQQLSLSFLGNTSVNQRKYNYLQSIL